MVWGGFALPSLESRACAGDACIQASPSDALSRRVLLKRDSLSSFLMSRIGRLVFY